MTERFPSIDRRTFIGGAAGLLGASALSPPVLGAPLTAADFKPTSGETVYFRGWQFRTDVVQGNVDTYNKTFDGHVDYATVTGDYPAVMEKTSDRERQARRSLRQSRECGALHGRQVATASLRAS